MTNVWQPQTLAFGTTLRYALPPAILWAARSADEIHLALERKPEAEEPDKREERGNRVEPADPPTEEPAWERFAVPSAPEAIRVRPALPDRPLVVRPVATMRIVPGHVTRLFVSIPVWWRIDLCRSDGGDAVFLADYPSTVLSKSWFGLPQEGEPCYALKTRARHALSEIVDRLNRAVCVIDLRNAGSHSLLFERFCLRAPNLALYADTHGHLWTGKVQVEFRGETEPAQVHHLNRSPSAANGAERIGEPRSPVVHGLTHRAFGHVRALTRNDVRKR